MNRLIAAALASTVGLSACSGNPFPVDDGGTTPDSGIPEEIAGDVTDVAYDPTNQVLVVSGQGLDNTPYQATYVRKPALDRNGYEAYTSQDKPLGRHHTAYVKDIDGARATIVMAGGQFGHVFAGGHYARTGDYSPPDVSQAGGLVQYAGKYVGLLNAPGDGGDLLPVAPGTPNEIRPSQAAEITGDIIISADFADNVVDGLVYNRVVVDDPNTAPTDLELADGVIAEDGSFTGAVQQNNGQDTAGAFGGIFAGSGASAVAGSLFSSDHIDEYDNEFEHGLFVLSQCGSANADPVCNQPTP